MSKPPRLITLDLQPDRTVVRVGDATIGGDELAIMAGPCAVESRDQTFAIAEAVQASGARFLRGGAFKPRSSPSFASEASGLSRNIPVILWTSLPSR